MVFSPSKYFFYSLKRYITFNVFSTISVTGFKDVKFHVKGDVDNYSNKDIDDILEELAEMLKCEKWDILVNGVLPSMSFILVLLIKEAFTRRLNALDDQDCKKLGRLNIDYLIVDHELFLLDSSKGKPKAVFFLKILIIPSRNLLRRGIASLMCVCAYVCVSSSAKKQDLKKKPCTDIYQTTYTYLAW